MNYRLSNNAREEIEKQVATMVESLNMIKFAIGHREKVTFWYVYEDLEYPDSNTKKSLPFEKWLDKVILYYTEKRDGKLEMVEVRFYLALECGYTLKLEPTFAIT